jgi:hypothetical protein
MLNAKALQQLFPYNSKEFVYKTIKRLKEKHNLTYDESFLPLHIVKEEFNLSKEDIDTLFNNKSNIQN